MMIKPVLRCHSLCYRLAGDLSLILNDGKHPKHDIIRYEQWFAEHIEPGMTVLDVGCKTGRLPVVLAEKAGFVYGVEINKDDVDTAGKINSRPNIEYICADITELEFANLRPIHCITLSNVLEHIDNRTELLSAAVNNIEWADTEKKYILIRVPMIEREWIVIYKKQLGLEYRLDPTHYTEYTVQSLKEELDAAGIEIENIQIRFSEIYAVCRVRNVS